MKRFLVPLLGLVLTGALLAACGSDDDSGTASGGSSGAASDADFNDADVAFVQGMIPHHEQAVEMAKLAPTRAESAEVKDLAMRIEKAQGPEISTMKGWLEEWGVDESGGDMGGMGDDGGDTGMGGGMMTEGQLAELKAADGPEFDEMFLTMMIEHHEGAVEMAQTEVDDGKSPDAIALAEDIIEAQESEIEEMNGLLEA